MHIFRAENSCESAEPASMVYIMYLQCKMRNHEEADVFPDALHRRQRAL